MNSTVTPPLCSPGVAVTVFEVSESFLELNDALDPLISEKVILCSINEDQSKPGQGAPHSSCTGVKVTKQGGEHLRLSSKNTVLHTNTSSSP